MSKAKQKARREVIALMAERFPQCFSVEGGRVPLKVGIHADVLAALNGAIRPDELRRALASYTGNASYLRGVVPGACRRDLDGKPAGIVTREQASDASARLAKRQKAIAVATEPSLALPIAPGLSITLASTDASAVTPPRPSKPRLSLADLRAAGRQRRETAA